MRLPRRRFVHLVGRFQERDEAIVAEDAVVDDEAALFDMRAVGPDAGRGGYMAPSGHEGDPVAGGIDRAGDDGLVPGNAPGLPAVTEAEAYALVDPDQRLVYPAFPRQRRLFLHLERRRVYLHPPDVGRPRGYANGIDYGVELDVVEHQVGHRPGLLTRQLHRRHHRRRRRPERSAAGFAQAPALAPFDGFARPAERAFASTHKENLSGKRIRVAWPKRLSPNNLHPCHADPGLFGSVILAHGRKGA